MLAVSAAVVSDPEVERGSVRPEVARQDFTLVLAQVTVVVLLASRSVSATESVAVGAFQPVTVAWPLAEPPGPEQVRV